MRELKLEKDYPDSCKRRNSRVLGLGLGFGCRQALQEHGFDNSLSGNFKGLVCLDVEQHGQTVMATLLTNTGGNPPQDGNEKIEGQRECAETILT